MAIPSDRVETPLLQWSPIIGGALCALGAYIVIAMFGTALGWNSLNEVVVHGDTGSKAWAIFVTAFLAPIIAGGFGGYVASRLAGMTSDRFGTLHGVIAWCIALVVGVIAFGGLPGGRLSTPMVATHVSATDTHTIYAKVAALAGWSGIAAVLGFCAALGGALIARRVLHGRPLLPNVHRTHGHMDQRDHYAGYGLPNDARPRDPGIPPYVPRSDLDDPTLRH